MCLRDNIDKLKKSKVNIIKSWISDKNLLKILESYKVPKEVFIKDYGFGIFDYYVCVLEDKCIIGDCPVIQNLLNFLKDRDVGSDELFAICAGFKNALIEFMYDANIVSLDTQKEIIDIYERNFEGVLKNYSKTIHEVNNDLNISSHLIDQNIIMSTTNLQGIITSVSTAFSQISGYEKEELIGQPHCMVRHPDMSKEIFEDLWDTIKNDREWHGEIKNLRKDGNSYWVEATISPEFNSKGIKIGYSAIRHDITYKKEAQTQYDIIVEQSKATAMGEMISMIAHQWRQPLQAIAILIQKLPLEKLIDGKISDETLDSVVASIDDQLAHMSKTIEEFRSFFNPAKDKQKIYASLLIEQVRDFLAYSFKVDEIEFITKADEDIELNVHINEIIQVFINILNNAKEALAEKEIKNRRIEISYHKQKENIVFEIQDNAGGIPSIIINKIFEPYFSTKKNKNGTGLGLYMAKTIVEKNGQGILSVHNVDDGASFKIVLPIE